MQQKSGLKYIILILVILAFAIYGTLRVVKQKQTDITTTQAPSTSDTATSDTEPSLLTTVDNVITTASAPDTSVSAAPIERVTNPETGRVIVQVTDDNWQLIVVNGSREFPADYAPELDEIFSTGKYLDARVTPHYEEMYTAAKQDGITLTPYSAYRSYERQKNNYNHLTETYMADYHLSREEAAKKAATVILPPGTSEHNLGLCMDVCNVYDSFVNQPEYTWLTENAYKYGFILRYPKGKEDVTSIVFEPWHWRYVGVEWAKQIRDSGLCLEEFLDQQGIAW